MKHNTFNTITGLTQEEMATCLCIPRSQWSMSERSKRSLSQKSTFHFSMLHLHLKNNESITEEKKIK